MSEQSISEEAMKTDSTPKSEAKPEGGTNWITIVVVIAVAALIILAAASYMLWVPEDEEEVLEATVTPATAEVSAGATLALVANASWNGESINEALGTEFRWSVNDATLGSLSSPYARITNFVAGKAGGSGTITCNVTYIHEEASFNVSVTVDLVVNPPTLATVTVSPSEMTLIFDRGQDFAASAIDSVGDAVTGLTYTWTVEGIPAANYTISATTGISVNVSANTTGTAWVNATATSNGVTRTGSALIPVIVAPPTMDMDWANMAGGTGINWTCEEPTAPLDWDQIVVYLTDGTATVNWTLTMGGLDSGSMSMAEFGPKSLGALTIFLNVTDVTGNGSVNATDYFTFTTSGGKFNPAKDYIVTLVFTPSLDVIVQKTFRG